MVHLIPWMICLSQLFLHWFKVQRFRWGQAKADQTEKTANTSRRMPGDFYLLSFWTRIFVIDNKACQVSNDDHYYILLILIIHAKPISSKKLRKKNSQQLLTLNSDSTNSTRSKIHNFEIPTNFQFAKLSCIAVY